MRTAFGGGTDEVRSHFYPAGEPLQPLPAQRPSPPIWIGSWGSDAGLRRVARLGQGWLASGYNATPPEFNARWNRLKGSLNDVGRDAEAFPNAIATMFFHLTDDHAEEKRLLEDVIAPMVKRPVEELRERLPIGSAEHVLNILSSYREAGAQRIYMWPVLDEINQLTVFAREIAPTLRN